MKKDDVTKAIERYYNERELTTTTEREKQTTQTHTLIIAIVVILSLLIISITEIFIRKQISKNVYKNNTLESTEEIINLKSSTVIDRNIIDTIEYENLEPGTVYTITCTLTDKTTKQRYQLTSTFTPNQENGTAEIIYDTQSLPKNITTYLEGYEVNKN